MNFFVWEIYFKLQEFRSPNRSKIQIKSNKMEIELNKTIEFNCELEK